MKKKESEKIYDPKVAIIVADDFRKHSKTFVDKHPNRNRLDRHLAESDFVFCSDAGKNGFDLRFELGK